MIPVALVAIRAYVQKRFEQFLADYAHRKRNITVEAMHARGLTNGHDIMRDFRKSVLEKEGDRE